MATAIGDAAKRSGVKIETIRYYDWIGLLPAPRRTEGRHRLYSPDDLKRLRLIRRSRELEFSLDDIRNLFRLADRGHGCGEVREMTLAHAARIRAKINDLKRMERLLRETAGECAGGEAPECPIIDALLHAE